MKKDTKTFYWVLGIFVAVILFYQFTQSFSIFQFQTLPTLQQYTGRPVTDSGWISYFPESGIYYDNAKFYFNEDNLEFKSKVSSYLLNSYCKRLPQEVISYSTTLEELYVDSFGCQHWQYYVPYIAPYWTCGTTSAISCCGYAGGPETAYFLCDNPSQTFTCGTAPCYQPRIPSAWLATQPEIQEQIVSDFGGIYYSFENPDTQEITYGCYEELEVYRNGALIDILNISTVSSKQYSISGDLNSPLVHVAKMSDSWKVGPECKAVKNDYIISLPNLVDIRINSLSQKYNVSDKIFVNLSLSNNLTTLYSNFTLNFNVKTVLGESTSSVSKLVTIERGENLIPMEIPSGTIAEPLEITPKIELFYPTSNLEGVSLNKERIQTIPYISLGSFTFDKISINISQFNEVSSNLSSNSSNISISSNENSLISLGSSPKEEEDSNWTMQKNIILIILIIGFGVAMFFALRRKK